MANVTAMIAAKKAKLNEFHARVTKSQPKGSARLLQGHSD